MSSAIAANPFSMRVSSLAKPSYMQAKSFFYQLLTTTRVSVEPGYSPRWQMWPIPKPRDGLPIRLERID